MNWVYQGIFGLFIVQLALSSSVKIQNTTGFLIVSPSKYRPGTTVSLGVDLVGKVPCYVEINLYTSNDTRRDFYERKRSYFHVASTKGRFMPGKHGELKLKVPDIVRRYMKIEGVVCGVKTEKATIELQNVFDTVFIQTDKPIYKPGQKIRMRIISVGHELKPVGTKVSSVIVKEPSGSRVMQWKDVKLEDGIASLELQLSKEPVLGKWSIEATVGGKLCTILKSQKDCGCVICIPNFRGNFQIKIAKENQSEEAKTKAVQQIEVDKYVLPKFEVTVTPPPYLALDQGEFTTSICAKYTYGKPVKGRLRARICFKSNYWQSRGWGRRRWRTRRIVQSKCHNITRDIDGCTEITLSRVELDIASVQNQWTARFSVHAAVLETLTGIELTGRQSVYGIRKRSVAMTFGDGTSNQFKPGLPFKYVLKVTRPDGTPVTGVKVRVMVTRGYFWFSATDVFYNKIFVVQNGLIKEHLANLAHNAKSLRFYAELLDENPYPTESRYRSSVTEYFTAYAWYSSSLSYLQLSRTQDQPAKIGSSGKLKVRYTVRNDTGKKVDFYYNVLCRGNIVTSGVHTRNHPYLTHAPLTPLPTTPFPTTPSTTQETVLVRSRNETANSSSLNIDVVDVKLRRKTWIPFWRRATPPPLKILPEPVVENFEISFPVTQDMVPSCRVLMYYVRPDRETVADSIDFDVEDTLENQVSVSFSDAEKEPGKKSKFVLKAHPGSRVAFVAVDKSVHLLKSGNELTKDRIMPILNRLNIGRARNRDTRCGGNPYYRRKRSFVPYYGSNYQDASEAFNGFSSGWSHYFFLVKNGRVSDFIRVSDLLLLVIGDSRLKDLVQEAGVVFLSNLKVFTKPCPSYGRPRYEGKLMMMVDDDGQRGRMDALRPVARFVVGVPVTSAPNQPVNSQKKPAVRVRKEFPETWLWADEKLDATNGTKTIEVTVPDTITKWIANGFAMSSVAGIGVSEPASIKAFQPFFVQMTLPYSVIRGEEIPVTVTVFNYMQKCLPIKLTLNRKSPKYKVTSYNIHKLCVCGDAGQSVIFNIIPTELGHVPLTVKAVPSSARICPGESQSEVFSDAVTRKLLVEPEGVRQEYTKGTFFCAKDGGEYKEEFDLHVPAEYVPGSVFPQITIIGDIMGPAMDNLDDLLRMPYGCGEQNIASFAPNIYVMDYLTNTNQVTDRIKEKALLYMRSGYQRQLRYKRKKGSYSAFGDRDKQGSLMLTAFVIRTFARSKRYIFIDDKDISDSVEWLRRKQLKSGCFSKYGKVFSRSLQGGVNSNLTITAYTTIALLEAGKNSTDPMVSDALSCLISQISSIKTSYTTTLVSYALVLAKHPKAADMIKILRSKAISKGGQMYWSVSSDETTPTTPPPYWWYYRRPTADVEMTGYALSALLIHGSTSQSTSTEILDIIKWLSKQRNSYGGFSSTQDTCVALQALSEFAGLAYNQGKEFKESSLKGSLEIEKAFKEDFEINDNNRLVLQRIEFAGKLLPNKLKLSAKGVGCALLQTSVKYNIPEPKEVPAFALKVNVRSRRSASDEENTPCDPLKLEISAKWLKEDVSNMAVVDIKLVTGFSVREESLKNLRNYPDLNFKRYDIDGQNIMLYFDEIKDMTFSVDIHQDTVVKKLKPALVRVYDYYVPENEAKTMYNITENECYGDKIQNLCPKCLSGNEIEAFMKNKFDCSMYISLVKSSRGKIKIGKSYGRTKALDVEKERLSFKIPEYCPCEEIYDKVKSLVVAPSSYFKKTGEVTEMTLDSKTTFMKWPSKRSRARHLKHMVFNVTEKCSNR